MHKRRVPGNNSFARCTVPFRGRDSKSRNSASRLFLWMRLAICSARQNRMQAMSKGRTAMPRAVFDPAIPLALFDLIGREQEMARIKQRLTSGGALTLHGLPGVGKTALAVTLAHDPEIQASFTDGVLWA